MCLEYEIWKGKYDFGYKLWERDEIDEIIGDFAEFESFLRYT